MQQDIYFDELKIIHEKSRVVQMDDSRPFSSRLQPATEVSESPLAHNFILTYTSLEEISEESVLESAPVEQVNKSIQYFDGLGRPNQTIGIQASPRKHDFVQPFAYDKFGRETEKYLAYVSEGANGWFKSDAVGKESQNYLSSPQYWFYQSAEMIDHDQKPYAETRFEPSPLNRVVKQGAPGEEWGPDPDDSYNSDDHTIKFSYGTNEADEVFLWTYTRPQSQALGLIDAFDGTSPVYYDEDQLYKNKTKDEQGNEVIEFVDKFGKVVLKKVEAPDGNWAETYYVYDDFGNLVTVLPPQATDGLVVDYFGEQSADQQQFLSRWALGVSCR